LVSGERVAVASTIIPRLERRWRPWWPAGLLTLWRRLLLPAALRGARRFHAGERRIIRRLPHRLPHVGELDAGRSNAVLLTPWAMGVSVSPAPVLSGQAAGPFRNLRDRGPTPSERRLLSPSKRRRAARQRLPRVSMRDVVESQYQLLTRVLGVTHLKAVIGPRRAACKRSVGHFASEVPRTAQVRHRWSPRSSPADRQRWLAGMDELRRDPAGSGRAVVAARRAGGRLRRWSSTRTTSTGKPGPWRRSTCRTLRRIDAAGPAAGPARLLVVVPARDEVVGSRAARSNSPARAPPSGRAGRALWPPRTGLRERGRPARRRTASSATGQGGASEDSASATRRRSLAVRHVRSTRYPESRSRP